ncbi:hypothetical protein BC629DRAFT_1547309, partial [Irpex lacteus]
MPSSTFIATLWSHFLNARTKTDDISRTPKHEDHDDEKAETRVETREANSPSPTATPDDSRRSTKVDPHDIESSSSADPRYIIIFFTLIFVETGVLPLILFYSLRWGAHLSITKNLAIITSLIGTVSGFKLAQRSYDLWFRNGHESRRPIGAGRWGVDAS